MRAYCWAMALENTLNIKLKIKSIEYHNLGTDIFNMRVVSFFSCTSRIMMILNLKMVMRM